MRKSLLSLLTLLLLAALPAVAEDFGWDYTPASKCVDSNKIPQTKTFNGAEWTIEGDYVASSYYIQYAGSPEPCIQLGSANNPFANVKFSTDFFANKKIISVSVRVAQNQYAGFSGEISFGGTTIPFGTIGTSMSPYDFRFDKVGTTLELKFTNSNNTYGSKKNGNLLLGKIEVVYSDVDPEPVLEDFTFPVPENDTYTLRVGETLAIDLPANAPEIQYSIDDKDVAVIENNTIIAKKDGTAEALAMWKEEGNWNGGSKDFYIKVLPAGAIDFEYTFENIENLDIFDTAEISVPENAPAITYTSDNTNIVKVEGSTLVPVAPGTATITAEWDAEEGKWNAGKTTFTVTVTAPAPVDFTFDGFKDYSLSVGATEALVLPENAPAVTFASDNSEVAVVENGEIKALAIGTATITASWGGVAYKWNAGSVTFTVEVKKLPQVEIKKDELTVSSFKMSGSSYADYTYNNSGLGIAYKAHAAVNSNANIQINNNSKGYGIVVSENTNGNLIKKIDIDFSGGSNTLEVYGSNTAYTEPKDLYDSSKKGTLIGSISAKGSIEVTDAYKYIGFISKKGAIYIEKITLYWEREAIDPDAVAKPEITFDEAAETVAITCETEGAEIYYTLDGNEPTAESNKYYEPFAIEESCTVKAVAIKDGELSGVASKTISVPARAKNIAEMLSKVSAKDDKVIVNCELTVVYVNGLSVYVTDAEGGATLIYGDNSYQAGDVIPAGWEAVYSPFNGLDEFKGNHGAAVSKGEFTIATVESISKADINRVVILTNVTINEPTPGTKDNFVAVVNGTEITFRNNFELPSVSAGNYNVKLAVSYYVNQKTSEETLQAYPIEYQLIPLISEMYMHYTNENGLWTSQEMDGEFPNFSTVVELKKGAEFFFATKEAAPTAVAAAVTDKEGYFTDAHVFHAEGVSQPGETIEEIPTHVTQNEGLHKIDLAINEDATDHTAYTTFGGVTTGLENVAVDNAEVEYFNLQGVRVANPANGIFIRRQGNTITKVVR